MEFARAACYPCRCKYSPGESLMATRDTCCTIVPYFKVKDGKLEYGFRR